MRGAYCANNINIFFVTALYTLEWNELTKGDTATYAKEKAIKNRHKF